MDYEKKYKEILEKARQLCAYLTIKPFISDLQDLFPELKEPEDEKIRKQIRAFIKSRGSQITHSKTDAWLAYLEKQGEQKNLQYLDTSDCVPWSDEQTRRNLINFIKSLGATEIPQASYNRYLSYLEKQGKHKHQYNSRPRYVKEEELIGANKQGKCHFSKQELIDMGFAFNQNGDLAYPIHRIEKKEFVEWSEEDKRKLDYVCSILRDNFNENDKLDLDFPCMGDMVDWLKSLIQKLSNVERNGKNWKPTEEQLKTL